MGRFTLDEWLGLPVGVTVLLVVAMALLMFWAGELAESHFGRGKPWSEIAFRPHSFGKLAGQFYLRDMMVLKVMFTAIIVAAVLIAGASAFGLLDMSRVWVNPTYLWPGIVGGLIMGVGFVLGGFCPGTSVVAASTLKIDGMLFLAGALGGVWLFG